MSSPQTAPDLPPMGAGSADATHRPSRRRWGLVGLVLIAALALGLWMLRSAPEMQSPGSRDAKAAEAVRVAGPQLIAVQPDSPLANKLDLRRVAAERTAAPLLTVTGSIVARLAPGQGSADARWDFSQLELATTYADWLRARAEEPYAEQQLSKTRQLVAARISAQTQVVERLRRLVSAGTDAPKDLAKEEADLVQAQLEGQKEVFDAETAFKTAARTRTTLERQLFQAGVDPELLTQAAEGTAILVAEVPEGRMGMVHKGQAAGARFFALPGEIIDGHVSSLAPTLASERRTLRVFFELDEGNAQLRPGMFADVGLGTEPRDALFVPSDAVLHVGGSDYVLVQTQAGLWHVTEVQVGETTGTSVEIISGLAPGATIIGSGAILLKPLVVRALQS